MNATMTSVERIHYGSHDAIIGSLAAVMTGKTPLRTISRKNITRQIDLEQEDLNEMIEQGARGMMAGEDENGRAMERETKKAKVDEQVGGSSGSRATGGQKATGGETYGSKRERPEAGMAKRDWENYYFSLPVSVRSRLYNIFKMRTLLPRLVTGD